MKWLPWLLLWALPLLSRAAPLFRDGERWLAVGDSITHNGEYTAWIYLYYATRFPDTRVEVQNGGIAGDTVAGALLRYEHDLRDRQPTVATILLGMNDVQRRLYGEQPPTPALLAARAGALARYETGLAELVRRFKADDIPVILMTPSPYDETARLPSLPQTGVNEALAACSGTIRRLAGKERLAVIDLHGPMTELGLRLQTAEESATIIGPDRIHPKGPGHLVIAYFFLKAQGAPALVSRVELDAHGGRVTGAVKAEVRHWQATPEKVKFDLLADALPFPVPEEAREALKWVPFMDDLNREELQVRGLERGTYELRIDEEPVGVFSSGELARGINLADRATPQRKQAGEVLDQVREWRRLTAFHERLMVQVERMAPLNGLQRPVEYPEAARRLAAAETPEGYRARLIARYLKAKPQEKEIHEKVQRLRETIRRLARPKERRYRLLRRDPP
ncbi:MAG TPA: SGNH/GDSL hydrolase family protein [Chthoniobacteraceae bacterium]|nr:SGNH/GDSL hydrolase family protein [Chthoniobacteraceae bacterium]